MSSNPFNKFGERKRQSRKEKNAPSSSNGHEQPTNPINNAQNDNVMHGAIKMASETQVDTIGAPISSAKRHRGHNRGITVDKIVQATGGKPIEAEINEKAGRVTNKAQAKHVATMLGLTARQLPLVNDWRHLKEEDLKPGFDHLQSKVHIKGLDIDKGKQAMIGSNIGRLLKDHRYRIRGSYRKIGDAAKPTDMTMEKWREVTTLWDSQEYLEKCEKNKIARSHVKNPHCSGSTSYGARRAAIEDKERKEIGQIRLWKETHMKEDPNGEADPLSITDVKCRWVSTEAKETYHKMLKAVEEAEVAGEPVDEQAICNRILMPKGRSDYNIGLGYGVKPIDCKPKGGGITKQQLEEALRVSQEALRASEITSQISRDAYAKEIANLKLMMKKKMKQKQDQMDLMKHDLDKIKKMLHNSGAFSSPDSLDELFADKSSLTPPPSTKGKEKRLPIEEERVSWEDDSEDSDA